MSRLFPHTVYAEDQPFAHTILWGHILTRALTTGAVVGIAISCVQEASTSLFHTTNSSPFKIPTSVPIRGYSSARSYLAARAAATQAGSKFAIGPLPETRPTWILRLVRVTGSSTAITIGLTAIGTVYRMWGREKIEWQDRSWRLMENVGQLETDDWTFAGMFVALVGAGARGQLFAAGLKGVVGFAGLGSVGGTVAYLAWRHAA